MSEWKEIGDALDAEAKARRARIEPERMARTERTLRARGWTVGPGPDGFRSFRVVSPLGRSFVVWPYSGWWQGKTSGRGFEGLVKAGTDEAAAGVPRRFKRER